MSYKPKGHKPLKGGLKYKPSYSTGHRQSQSKRINPSAMPSAARLNIGKKGLKRER